MAAPLLFPICVSLLLGGDALVQAPASLPSQGVPDYRLVARKADALLHRETGTNLVIDDAVPGAVHRFRRPTNKVQWSLNSRDQRLQSISVEPIGADEEGTTSLLAALLVSVSAVDSLDEGVRMTILVQGAEAADGRPRMVPLRNGVKLYRQQAEHHPPKYRITL